MPLIDYQIEVATTGLQLGAGTDYIVHSWDGLGLPGIRDSNSPKPHGHGDFMGPEYVDIRPVTINASIRGDDGEDAMDLLDDLIAAWYFEATDPSSYDTTSYLTVKLPGHDERRLYGRPRRSTINHQSLLTGHPSAALEWVAGDPRWYSDTEHSTALTIAAATTGRSYPRTFDYGYGGGTSNTKVVNNAGSFVTEPFLRLDGPLTNATITNATTGETLTITYTLGSGEYLEIDFRAKTVMLNGTASRYSAKSGTWWALKPGNNEIDFTVGSGSGSGTLTHRDAWL